VKQLTRKKPGATQPSPETERRRIGTVVHDDRGNASVDWRDAPSDFERPVLEVLGDPGLTIKTDETYDPYALKRKERPAGAGSNAAAGGTRTDLRKLSEWIKMMRELEQRKLQGEGGDGSDGGDEG
jgi:hypothetical protein